MSSEAYAWFTKHVQFSFLLSILVGVAGCGVSADTEVELGTVRQAVAGGTSDEDNAWPSVVMLRTVIGSQTQLCSGTLIAPNIVVTALHCVAPLDDGDFACDYMGNANAMHPGAGELGHPVEPNLIQIRAGFDAYNTEPVALGQQLFTTNSANICTNDLAFVVLDTELDIPVSALRLTEETVQGEPLTVVGFGTTGQSGDSTERRFRDNVRVTDLGTDDGSDPLSAAPPRTLVVGPSACEGDSGGPAFAKNKSGDGNRKQPVIAGVNSIAVGQCGSDSARSVFTRLDPFKPLILEAFEAAGFAIWEEGQLSPGEAPPEPDPVETDESNDQTDISTEPTTPTQPDESEPETPAGKPRRLTTGCSATKLSGDKTQPFCLALIASVVLRRAGRRRTTPISRR